MQPKLFRRPLRAGLVGSAALLTGLLAASPVAAQSVTPGSPARHAKIGSVGSRMLGGSSVPDVRIGRPAGSGSIKKVTSKSWSGYVDADHKKSGTFRDVEASWNVPEISDSQCPSGSYGIRDASVYAGLDGWTTDTQELAGTQSICDDGTLEYGAFIEMAPDGIAANFAVNPGDHISAYVGYSSGKWLLSVADANSGKSISQLLSCPKGSKCLNYSAEVVAAAPPGCAATSGQRCNGMFYPIADFGYVYFSGISVATKTVGGSLSTSSFGPEEVTAKKGKIVMSEVTKTLKSDAFKVSWKFSGATG